MFTIKNGDMILRMLRVRLVIKKGLRMFIFQRIKFSLKNKSTQPNSITNPRTRKKPHQKDKATTTKQNHQKQTPNYSIH